MTDEVQVFKKLVKNAKNIPVLNEYSTIIIAKHETFLW